MRVGVGTFVGALFGVLTIACGGRAGLKPKHDFPSRETLDKIASEPVQVGKRPIVTGAATWRVEPADDTPSPIDGLLPNVRITRELRCVARELGKFQLEQGTYPDERLRHFMIAACGYPYPDVSISGATNEVPAEVKDEEIFPRLHGPDPTARATLGGAWFGRKGNRVVTSFVAAAPHGEVTVTPADANGRFVVSGTLGTAPVEHVLALVNQGAFGVGRCARDEGHPLPTFSFTCAMKEGDEHAWVEIATNAPGRVLWQGLAQVLARRDGAGALVYTGQERAARAAAAAPREIGAVVANGVNRARGGAKLAPLEVLPGQTVANERLAPHFFGAELANDDKKADTVALGLLAGWDVGATIRDGNFYGVMLSGTDDPDAWLAYALDMPMGRWTLLDGRATRMAVGAAPSKTFGGVGVVVTTYDLYGATDHAADAARLAKRLEEARWSRGLAPHKIYKAPSLVEQVRLVNAGDKNEMTALDDAMSSEVMRLGSGVRGWVSLGARVDDLDLPKDLLVGNPAFVAIEVTHYRIEGVPWGVLAAFFLSPQQAVQRTASASGRACAWPPR